MTRTAPCIVCGRTVVSGKRGKIREIHPACKPLGDTLVRLEKALESGNLEALNLTTDALLELRYRLFCLTSEVPRPRYPRGHPKAGQFIPGR